MCNGKVRNMNAFRRRDRKRINYGGAALTVLEAPPPSTVEPAPFNEYFVVVVLRGDPLCIVGKMEWQSERLIDALAVGLWVCGCRTPSFFSSFSFKLQPAKTSHLLGRCSEPELFQIALSTGIP